MPSTDNQLPQSTTYRIVTFAFGVLFVGCAVVIFQIADLSLGVALAGAVVGGLGMDAMISALRAKRSLLARIGPLP